MKTKIETKNAPAAIGPYSQAILAGNTLYVSGQLPIDPATGEINGCGIITQTKQALSNLGAILAEAGATMNDVVKTTVLLKDINDFATMNEIYSKFFNGVCPARATYQVVALPKGVLIEIEAVAVIG